MSNRDLKRIRLHEAVAAVFAFVLFVGVSLVFFVTPVNGSFNSVTNTVGVVNVLGTCFISLVPTSIIFTNTLYQGVEPGSNVGVTNVVTDNDLNGNVNANILVDGTPWCSPSQGTCTNSFGVQNTVWNPSSNTNYRPPGNILTASLADTQIVVGYGAAAQPGANVYFGLAVPNSIPIGLYTQNILIENSC